MIQKIVTIFLKVERRFKKRLEERGDNLTISDIELRLGRLEYEESKICNYDYMIKMIILKKLFPIIKSIIENENKILEE